MAARWQRLRRRWLLKKRKQANIKTTHIDSSHVFHYAIQGCPTALWASESLLGLDRISERLPVILSAAYGSAQIPRVELYVCSVATGSLTDNVIVRLMFGSEASMNDWLVRVRQATGIERMQERHPLVGPVLTGLIVFGGAYAAVRMAGNGGSGTHVNLSKCSNNIVQVGAAQLNIPAESYKNLLQENAGNMFNVASNACKVLLPAREGKGSVTVDGNQNLVVTSEAVKEVPIKIDRSVEPKSVSHLKDVSVQIRALDRDSHKHGWAVVVPSISGKRLRLELDQSIDVTKLSETLRADIDLYYDTTDEGDRIYKVAYLVGVR